MREIFIRLNIQNTTKGYVAIIDSPRTAVTAVGPKIISHIRKMWCKSLQTGP